MTPAVKVEYIAWRDSLLSESITEQKTINKIDEIWRKASEAYPRATWPGWVDHSAKHVLNVLRNLDLLIPDYVRKEIGEAEAFALIAATLLHDIGMVPEENISENLQYLANLRQKHGEMGVKIIKRDFKDFLLPHNSILDPVCEIVKNHHGKFAPKQIIGLSYDVRADALWIRLADELDFGPNRAPTWLLDYISPDEKSLEHWKQHNQISEPSIDLNLFRVQVRGKVGNETFIRKLRAEFEADQSMDLQRNFLNRGLKGETQNRTFLIFDDTKIIVAPGEDSKEIDARPAIFSKDEFLRGARYLYNLGRYDTARKCFEDGVNRLCGRWSDMPATPYFYHYVKTLHALGHHQDALRVTAQYMDVDFSPEIRAALMVSDGLGYWKLGNLDIAITILTNAAHFYRNLSQREVKHKINEADAWVLYAITILEAIRFSNAVENSMLIERIKSGLRKAEELFSEYERKNPEVPETHYKGRYWGLRAFYHLLQIDFDPDGKWNEDVWAEALQFAKNAHGGDESAGRNPFGAMCGMYCAAAINYHKYDHCEDELNRQQALFESASLIRDVRQTYDDLFGHTKRIFRLWSKIHRLFVHIREALPDDHELKRALSGFYGSEEPVDPIEIYTPLH